MVNGTKEKIFALIPDRVEVGDIVLTSRAAVPAFFIRLFSISAVSHAAICTRPGMLLEAVPEGVVRQSVFETHSYKRKWLRVLRPKQQLGPNALGLNVEHYAEQHYEYKYSTVGAFATLIPKWSFDDEGAVFCSRLVAEAYAQFGLDLFPGKKPCKFKPGTLLRSPVLDNVTAKCVRELDPDKDAELIGLIRATSEISSAANDIKVARRTIKEIHKRLGTRLPPNIHSLPVLRHWLSANSAAARNVDQEIMQILSDVGYIEAMETWLTSVDVGSQQLDNDTAQFMQQPEIPSAEVDWAVALFSEAFALSETSLIARRLTQEEHENMAQSGSLATLAYFSDLYHRVYLCFERKRSAELRFISVLKALRSKGN